MTTKMDPSFPQEFKSLRDELERCEFVAFDLEMSGLNNDPTTNQRILGLEPPWSRYQHYRKTASDFVTLQLGICTFSTEAGEGKEGKQSGGPPYLSARPFSFHCFPGRQGRDPGDRVVSFQASSTRFLSEHKFNFNKALINGLNMMTYEEENHMIRDHEDKLKRIDESTSGSSRVLPTKHWDITWLAQVKKLCQGLLERSQKGTAEAPKDTKSEENAKKNPDSAGKFETIESEEDCLKAQDCLRLTPKNGFQRKLVYDLICHEFPTLHAKKAEIKDNKPPAMLVFVMTKEEIEAARAQAITKKRQKFAEEMADRIGLRAVLEAIHASGKPMVGHNCLMDTLRLVNDFIIPLPPSYFSFKAALSRVFPAVYDTRFIITHPDFRAKFARFRLEDAYNTAIKWSRDTNSIPNIKPSASVEMQAHDAGYDAYMTGSLFGSIVCAWDKSRGRWGIDPSIAGRFVNRLSLYRCASHIYLAGPDPYLYDLSGVFYMCESDILRKVLFSFKDNKAKPPLPLSKQTSATLLPIFTKILTDLCLIPKSLKSKASQANPSSEVQEQKNPTDEKDEDSLVSLYLLPYPKDPSRYPGVFAQIYIRDPPSNSSGGKETGESQYPWRRLLINQTEALSIVSALNAKLPYFVTTFGEVVGTLWPMSSTIITNPSSIEPSLVAGSSWAELEKALAKDIKNSGENSEMKKDLEAGENSKNVLSVSSPLVRKRGRKSVKRTASEGSLTPELRKKIKKSKEAALKRRKRSKSNSIKTKLQQASDS